MATYDPKAHDGLEVADSNQAPGAANNVSYSDKQTAGGVREYYGNADEGKQYVPHSDKQVSAGVREYYNKVNPDMDYHNPTNIDFSQKEVDRRQQHIDSDNDKRICGLKRSVLLIICGLLTIVIVVAAVGGGIAGSSGHRARHTARPGDSSSTSVSTITSLSTTTPSSTISSSSATSTPTSGFGIYNCPSDNSTIYTSSINSRRYRIVCNIDWPSDIVGVNGGTVSDLNNGVIATSIESCIDQCAGNRAGGGQCTAVTYGANITLALSRGGITGNCFMKTQRGANGLADNSGQVESAWLIVN